MWKARSCATSWRDWLRPRSSRRSVPRVVVLRDDLLGGDLSPGLESRARSAGGSKTIGDGALEYLQLGEDQEEASDIGQVRGPFRRFGTMDHALHLLADQFRWLNYQNLLDHLVRRQVFDSPNIHEVTVLRLANLVQAVAETIRHGPNPDSDLKALREVRSQLLGQLRRPGREDVDILGHPRFINVRVHRVCAKEHGVGPPAQELQHGVVDRRQRQGFTHDELSKCQRAVPEHESPPQVPDYPCRSLATIRGDDTVDLGPAELVGAP